MKKIHLSSLLGFVVTLVPSLCRATNPCDANPAYCTTSDLPKDTVPSAAGKPAKQEAASAQKPTACPDGRELDGRVLEVTLTFKTGTARVLKMSPDRCDVQYPRDEPPMPPYTRRGYKSADGAVLAVYTGSDRPTSTLSLRLADDLNLGSASLIPAFRTDTLASGSSIDLGEVLLVGLDKSSGDGKVIPVKMSIRSVASDGR